MINAFKIYYKTDHLLGNYNIEFGYSMYPEKFKVDQELFNHYSWYDINYFVLIVDNCFKHNVFIINNLEHIDYALDKFPWLINRIINLPNDIKDKYSHLGLGDKFGVFNDGA